MKKRIMCTTLAFSVLLIFCFFLLPTEVQAAEVASGKCGADLTWVLDGAGTLTISGTGAMSNYFNSAGVPWCSRSEYIKKVVIERGVTSIGTYAFSECSRLTSVTIPDSVTSIGASAFSNSIKLTDVTIPNSVTTIGSGAFAWCSSLTSVILPNSITCIDDSMFSHCSRLTSVTIPSSVTSIGSYAFYSCSKLTRLVIPSSVTSIGSYAFYSCSSLTSVTIPDGIASIGNNTFWGCSKLKNVTIGNSVTTIGYGAFFNCSSLDSVIIPDSVISIAYDAFRDCSGLIRVVIGNGVTTIGSGAFAWCSSLTNVTIPDSVTSIDVATFWNCSRLTSVTIPDSVTSISNSAFRGCSGLTSVIIGKNMDKIDGSAFDGCRSLWHVLYKGTQEDWDRISIGNENEYLISATRHYNCIGNEIAANGCTVCMANCQHNYSDWTKVNDATHKHTCELCGQEETASHSWNSGSVTKLPTCNEEGVKTLTCTTCNGTKNEAVAKTTTHNYSTKWSADMANHWFACTICGAKKDLTAHTPGAEATETTAQTCTICSHVIKEALGHTHNFGNAWLADDTNHWRVCACGEKVDEAAHTWVGTACSVCSTQNPTPPTEPGTEPPTEPATEPSTGPDVPTTGKPMEPNHTAPSAPVDNSQESDGCPIWIYIVVVVAIAAATAGMMLIKKKH